MGIKSEIEQALEAHAAWRKRFRDFLSGHASFDVASVGATDQCQFGKWLNHEGEHLLPTELHDDIRAAHDEFHRIAASILQKIRDKQFAAAHGDLAPDGAFNQASVHLADFLFKATLHAPGSGATEKEAAVPAGQTDGTPVAPAATEPPPGA